MCQKTKVLVTGANGQLGYDVVQCLTKRGISCLGVKRTDFDLTDYERAEQIITEYNPDAVIHCAAYTAVDRAEEEEKLCYKVNVEGTKTIVSICKKIGAKLMYISTDYVFSGKGEQFYKPGDDTNPLGVYGKSKLLGEEEIKLRLEQYFIVRISWVFGLHGNNFVKTMLRIGQEKKEVHVVSDQIGSPTYTKDLAELLCDMILTKKYGIYHATNEGICSWAQFAREIFLCAGYPTKVVEISTEEYPTKAQRPKNSRLSKQKLKENGFCQLPDWKSAIERYIKEYNEITKG